jgi:hypothetical protein
MPDSPLPPIWGPLCNERDLEALLSGESYGWSGVSGPPEDLHPVAGALAALRAAPARSELSGEARARAMFRATSSPVRVPAPWAADTEHGTVTAAAVPVPRAADTEHGTVTARTLVPSPGDRHQRHGARHRHRRGTRTWAVRRPAIAAAGAVAIAVIAVIAVAVTGVLPGSATRSHPVSAGTPSAVAAEPSASQRVEGGALVEPPIRPTPAASASSSAPHTTPSPGTLCREYYSFLAHQEPSASLAAEAALGEKLDALAGGHSRVFTFCFRYLDYLSWGKAPEPPPKAPAQAAHTGGPAATAKPDPSPSPVSSGPGNAGTGNTGSAGAGSSGAGGPVTGKSGAGGSGSQTGSGPG